MGALALFTFKHLVQQFDVKECASNRADLFLFRERAQFPCVEPCFFAIRDPIRRQTVFLSYILYDSRTQLVLPLFTSPLFT